MDGNILSKQIILRCRKPGDKIDPIGMNGHSMKISDLMINLKLPERARKTWPLVCSTEDVLWVPGYRLSDRVRLKPASTSAVHMALFRDFTT
jgi:tRNA(Ile)-lysidine synthase